MRSIITLESALVLGSFFTFGSICTFFYKTFLSWSLVKEEIDSQVCKLKITGPKCPKVEICDAGSGKVLLTAFERNEFHIVDNFKGELYLKVYENSIEPKKPFITQKVYVNTTDRLNVDNRLMAIKIGAIMEKLSNNYLSILFTGGKGCGKSTMITRFIDYFIEELGYEIKVSQYRSGKEEFKSAESADHVTTEFRVVRLEKEVNKKTVVLELIDSPGIEHSTKTQAWYGVDMEKTFAKIMSGQVRVKSCVFGARNATFNPTNPDECIPIPRLALVCIKSDSLESGDDSLLPLLRTKLQKKAYSVSTKIDESLKKVGEKDKKPMVLKFRNGIFEEEDNVYCIEKQHDLQFFTLTDTNYPQFRDCKGLIAKHTAKFIYDLLDRFISTN